MASQLGRNTKITFPDLGDAAGASQVNTQQNTIAELSNDDDSRYRTASAVADSVTTTFDHDFGIDFSETSVLLYTGTHPNLTRVSDPAGAGWTIQANVTNPKTQMDIITPASGGPHTFAVIIKQGVFSDALASTTETGLVSADNQTFGGIKSFTGFGKVLTTKSADYTILDDDDVNTILMTTAGTDRTVTLPTAADNANRQITIKKVDSGTGSVTIDGEGAETIDGATTIEFFNQYNFITVNCDGTSWHITDKNITNRWQKHELSGDQNTSSGGGGETSLNFANLEVGKIYRLTVHMSALLTGTNGSPPPDTGLDIWTYHNGSPILKTEFRHHRLSDNGQRSGKFSDVLIFKATGTTLIFQSFMDGTATLRADDTYTILEELNNYEDETNVF